MGSFSVRLVPYRTVTTRCRKPPRTPLADACRGDAAVPRSVFWPVVATRYAGLVATRLHSPVVRARGKTTTVNDGRETSNDDTTEDLTKALTTGRVQRCDFLRRAVLAGLNSAAAYRFPGPVAGGGSETASITRGIRQSRRIHIPTRSRVVSVDHGGGGTRRFAAEPAQPPPDNDDSSHWRGNTTPDRTLSAKTHRSAIDPLIERSVKESSHRQRARRPARKVQLPSTQAVGEQTTR